MKVLVIGSGGREHALAWKLAQSPRIGEVLVAPGNAGTAHEGKCRNIDVAASDIDGLLALVEREAVDVTGWLGGYNFQWAWASGWAAGQML